MKDYTKSIMIIEARREKLKELVGVKVSLATAYDDAIECMKRCNPMNVKRKADGSVTCPVCGKKFLPTNSSDFTRGARICNNCGQSFKW